jgi:hypothetical protein
MKNFLPISFLLTFILLANICIAQSEESKIKRFAIEEDDWYHKREVSLNVTSLIHNLVPFNLGESNPGFIGIRSKFYDKKYAFRVNFGASLVSNVPNSFFYLSLGYERRRIVAKRWAYTSGWDLFTGAGLFTENPDEILFGITRHYAIEYYFNERCYISTDAQLLIGAASTAAFKFVYPNSIYFNIRL